jgi:hypothetical protein
VGLALVSAAGQARADANSVPLEAIAITAGAVVIAAVIAAVAAHYRQKTALDAETKRLAEQLEAESTRLEKQLDHDREETIRQLEHTREQTDVAELRNLLDHSIALILDLYDAHNDLELTLQKQVGTTYGELPREDQRTRAGDYLRLAKAQHAVVVDGLRLAARLPWRNPVVEAHSKVREAAKQGPPDLEDTVTDDQMNALDKQSSAIWMAQAEFIEAARDLIGSQLRA